MNNRKKLLLYALIGVLFIGGLYYFFRPEPASPDAAAPGTPPKPDILFEKTSLVEELDGKRLWELNAETISINAADKTAALTNVKGTFYRDDGSSVTMIAQKGIADTASKKVVLSGEVMAVSSSDGASFSAPQVRWAGELRWFFAEGGVKFIKDETVMTGEKLDSDVAMEQVKIYGNAKIVSGGDVR